MNNTLKIVLAIIVAGVLIGGSLFLTKKEEVKEVPVVEQSDMAWASGITNSCMDGDTNNFSYCNCATNYLMENYTRNEILEMGRKVLEGDNLPKPLIDASATCSYLY